MFYFSKKKSQFRGQQKWREKGSSKQRPQNTNSCSASVMCGWMLCFTPFCIVLERQSKKWYFLKAPYPPIPLLPKIIITTKILVFSPKIIFFLLAKIWKHATNIEIVCSGRELFLLSFVFWCFNFELCSFLDCYILCWLCSLWNVGWDWGLVSIT